RVILDFGVESTASRVSHGQDHVDLAAMIAGQVAGDSSSGLSPSASGSAASLASALGLAGMLAVAGRPLALVALAGGCVGGSSASASSVVDSAEPRRVVSAAPAMRRN